MNELMPDTPKLPVELLRQWVEETSHRLTRMLEFDPESASDGQTQFSELVKLSEQFLYFAKAFVKMAETCRDCLEKMERRGMERGRGPESADPK
jgi:hypothetical protein